jgi:hypothetical protein
MCPIEEQQRRSENQREALVRIKAPCSNTLIPNKLWLAATRVRGRERLRNSVREAKEEEKYEGMRWIIPLLLMSALKGTAAAQDVHTDYDRHVPFERFHTYSWGRVQTSNPLK